MKQHKRNKKERFLTSEDKAMIVAMTGAFALWVVVLVFDMLGWL